MGILEISKKQREKGRINPIAVTLAVNSRGGLWGGGWGFVGGGGGWGFLVGGGGGGVLGGGVVVSGLFVLDGGGGGGGRRGVFFDSVGVVVGLGVWACCLVVFFGGVWLVLMCYVRGCIFWWCRLVFMVRGGLVFWGVRWCYCWVFVFGRGG